ncbi:cocaine- and amphetamine-regulated transcript 4 [Amia ocellicauda]|uniref:cocaine- and amphetamine-regulated transcript 4 n=1 Tax=Amia ocellicauda TaxID=2972642 RepID=UPI0034646E23
MDSGSFRIRSAVCLGLCLAVLAVACQGQMEPETGLSSEEEQIQRGYAARELVEALEGLLEGSQGSRISLEKKASQIPRCDVGERCAVKHGPRIGKLCDCLRGAACNTFLLRCY